MRGALRRLVGVVTEHNLLVLVVMLVLTAGVTAGVSHLQMGSNSDPSASGGDTDASHQPPRDAIEHDDVSVSIHRRGTDFSISAELSAPIPLAGSLAEFVLVRLLLESEPEAMVANLKKAAETESVNELLPAVNGGALLLLQVAFQQNIV